MEELKKKKLVLAESMMTQEEFEQLVADRNESIVDSLINLLVNSSTSETPPANELIVNSPHNSNVCFACLFVCLLSLRYH
jgi:hypothetical protein